MFLHSAQQSGKRLKIGNTWSENALGEYTTKWHVYTGETDEWLDRSDSSGEGSASANFSITGGIADRWC